MRYLKQYTHAWIVLMAAKLLHKVRNEISSTNKKSINRLLRFLRENNDEIVQGAWFPDSVIHDNSTGHIWQLASDQNNVKRIYKLPGTSKIKKLSRITRK